MRLGVLIGFLIGGAIASLLASSPGDDAEGAPRSTFLERLKEQTEKARAAAREASAEKQAEILREWEASRRRHEDS